MNKFKNPRLKHVKKIIEIADSIRYWSPAGCVVADQIVDQCNLLLETKKKKKRCERCAKGFTCYSHGAYPVRPEHSPQPNDDGHYGASGAGTPHTSSPQPEKIEADENEDWFTSKQYAKNYREREELCILLALDGHEGWALLFYFLT